MKKTLTILTALGMATLLVAAAAQARGGGKVPELTEDERSQIQEIRDSYRDKFDGLRDKLQANAEDIDKLMTNDEATLGELKEIREERAELRREMGVLRDQMREEVLEKMGIDFAEERYPERTGYDRGKEWRKENRHDRRYYERGEYREHHRKGGYRCDKPCNPVPDCGCRNR